MAPLPNFSDSANDASALIREICGWHVWPVVTETVRLSADNDRMLMLPSMKVVDVTTITETWRGVGASVRTLVADRDYYWWENGAVERVGCWTSRPRGIVVTYTHGYAERPKVLQELAASLGDRLAGNPRRLTQQTAGQVSESYGVGGGVVTGGLLQEEFAQLARYRRVV